MKNKEDDFLYSEFPLVEGWISTDGKWYECKYLDHQEFALQNFSCTRDDLYNKGWIKINYCVFQHKMTAESKNFRASKEQKETLLKIGFTEKSIEKFYIFN